MAEILILHHVLGRTDGMERWADWLREAGHTVHVPDLFEGARYASVEEGIAAVKQVGFAVVAERGVAAADELPESLVYLGFSLGVMPAQQLAQTRPGALGAIFLEACLPADEFGSWPEGLPAQIHGMESDSFFAEDGDLDAAKDLAAAHPAVELHTYPGNAHLFTDPSAPGYDQAAADTVRERVLEFLARL